MINQKTRQIKLIDFGSTVPLTDEPVTIFYGTRKFSAPEALQNGPFRLQDQEVWALGTLLYVMLFKMDPFGGDDEIENLDIAGRISRLRSKRPAKYCISDAAAYALSMMLAKNPKARPKISEISRLSIFKNNIRT